MELKNGYIKVQSGEQFLSQFSKQWRDADGNDTNLVIKMLDIVKCYDTGSKLWLCFRIKGACYCAKKR